MTKLKPLKLTERFIADIGRGDLVRLVGGPDRDYRVQFTGYVWGFNCDATSCVFGHEFLGKGDFRLELESGRITDSQNSETEGYVHEYEILMKAKESHNTPTS